MEEFKREESGILNFDEFMISKCEKVVEKPVEKSTKEKVQEFLALRPEKIRKNKKKNTDI